MTMSATDIARLNKSNEAHRLPSIGTIIAANEALLASVSNPESLGAINKIEATIAFGDFVDVTTTGTYTFTETIPIGAVVYACVLQPALVGFAGDTSAVITVGDGTDGDRYMTGTPDVFSDVAGGIALGAVSGTAYHAAAKSPVVTITTAADFTSVTAGSIEFALYYFV